MQHPQKSVLDAKFSHVTVPTSLSLLLSSGFSPLEPAGSFFLKHKPCPDPWMTPSYSWAVGDHRGAQRGSQVSFSVTSQDGWTQTAAEWFKSTTSARSGRMRSGSGDGAEQLSPEHFPPLLNSLEAGMWQEHEQSQAWTTKGMEITVPAPKCLNRPDPAGHEPGVPR